MAKLSQKKARRLSFIASKLALSPGHDERMTLLTELLDELGIDAEQRADSLDSAQRSVNYDAAQRRKAAKQNADPIDNMSRDEVRAYIKQLYAKRDAILAQRAEQQPATTPEPAPVVVEAPQYALPTKRMEKAVAQFDDLTDSEQVDQLRSMGW